MLWRRRNNTGFSWEDNSTALPTLVPSGQDYTGPAYSHWGKVGNNPAEPNGDNTEFCALAGSNMYTYFSGTSQFDRVSCCRCCRAAVPGCQQAPERLPRPSPLSN
jgi:hypothetical protein